MSNSLLIHAEYNKTETLSWTKYKNPRGIQECRKKTFRQKYESMSYDLCLEQRFNKWQKAQSIKKKADKANIIKIKNAQISKDITKKWKDKLQTGKIYL